MWMTSRLPVASKGDASRRSVQSDSPEGSTGPETKSGTLFAAEVGIAATPRWGVFKSQIISDHSGGRMTESRKEKLTTLSRTQGRLRY